MKPDFEKTPLMPAVVQDYRTGQVRMLGYMDREAYDKTLETGDLHLHSRSRDALWRKGETSGNVHGVKGLSLDCDGDALLVEVSPEGPTCHTGKPSCFFERLAGLSGAGTLARLEATVAERKASMPAGSRTAELFSRGTARIAQKVGEEAVETVVASLVQDSDRLVAESADLLYHLTVLWADRGVALSDVLDELERRAGERP